MTEDEIRYLLATVMAYDNRRPPGDATVEAWLHQADQGGWTLTTALAAVSRYYETATSGSFLMPGDINAVLAEVRKRIRARHTEDVCPPRELADDPRAEIEWRRRRIREYEQRALEAWARGEDLPELDQRVELGETERPQLSAAVRSLAALKSVPRDLGSTRWSPARDRAHRSRLDAARAELANLPRAAGEDR